MNENLIKYFFELEKKIVEKHSNNNQEVNHSEPLAISVKYQDIKENNDEDKNETNIEILPVEIMVYIFAFASLSDGIQNVSLVCQSWHALIQSEEYWVLMSNKHFPGIRKEQYEKKSYQELFLSLFDNSQEEYDRSRLLFREVVNDLGQESAKELYHPILNKLFARIKEGDLEGFLNIYENECLVLFKLNSNNKVNNIEVSNNLLYLFELVKDFTGNSLLSWCQRLGHDHLLDGIFIYLLQHDVTASQRYAARHNTLSFAALYNQFSLLKILIKIIDINSLTNEQSTALSLSVEYGCFDSTRYLLEAGANPNLSLRGILPVCKASEKGDMDTVLLLLDHGAYIDAENEIIYR